MEGCTPDTTPVIKADPGNGSSQHLVTDHDAIDDGEVDVGFQGVADQLVERTGDPTSTQDVKGFHTFHLRGGRSFKIKAQTLVIILTVCAGMTELMAVVSLPLLNNTVDKYGDFYPVVLLTSIWHQPFFFGLVYINNYLTPKAETRPSVPHRVMIMMGILNAVSGVLIVNAADPKRTSAALQALLGTSLIPFTVVVRFIVLRKGVGRGRLLCTAVVLLGLFVALEPEIYNLKGTDATTDPDPGAETGVMAAIWPILFLLGYLPLAIANVLVEREIKKEQTESLAFLAWVQLYSAIFVLVLFWTDFIPGFGAADSIEQFGQNMLYSFKCMHFADPECMTAVAGSFVFILAYCLDYLVIFLLVKFAEGAIWLVLVQALVTPLGSLFFTLFSVAPLPGQDQGKFHWAPNFDLAVAFRIAGLTILVPTIIVYNYFGEKERRAAERELASESHSEQEQSVTNLNEDTV